jgi:hypothetical protein
MNLSMPTEFTYAASAVSWVLLKKKIRKDKEKMKKV